MEILDWLILIVLIVSGLISLKRGFVKELLSLVTWVAALIIARTFSPQLSELMSGFISTATWRAAIAFFVLFVATLVVGAMLSHLLASFVKKTGLTSLDRTLGIVFGLLRGTIIIIAVLAIGRQFALDQLWQGSILHPYFEPLIEWTQYYIYEASNAIIQSAQ